MQNGFTLTTISTRAQLKELFRRGAIKEVKGTIKCGRAVGEYQINFHPADNCFRCEDSFAGFIYGLYGDGVTAPTLDGVLDELEALMQEQAEIKDGMGKEASKCRPQAITLTM